MAQITVTMDDDLVGRLDDMVAEDPTFESRSEAIRYALRQGLQLEVTDE